MELYKTRVVTAKQSEIIGEARNLTVREIADDLKSKIVGVVASQPHARKDSRLVLTALFELAFTLAESQYGSDARKIWVGAFDEAERQKKPRKPH